MLVLNLDSNFKLEQYKTFGMPIDNLNAELFNFSAGEVHIKLQKRVTETMNFLISNRINNSDNLIQILLAADALRRTYGNDIKLHGFFPYLPYGRQDRPMIEGEPFSLKVIANIINTVNFKKIFTLDPHSDVTPALIDNLEIFRPNYLLQAKEDILKKFGDFVLVAPDGGALKKIYKQAKFIDYKNSQVEIPFSVNVPPVVIANKVRNVADGKIIATILPQEVDYQNKTFWIMDDILDGGRTFIELAKELRAKGAKKVVLSVSHAIVSHGEEELRKCIDKIYTTNSIKDDESELIRRFKI